MTDPRHAIQRGKKIFPSAALFVQDALPLSRQLIKAATTLARLLDPTPLNQTAPLQAIEQRIERRDGELQHAIGTLLDELRNLVAVPRPVFNQSQDQHLRTAPFDLPIQHSRRLHMWYRNICKRQRCVKSQVHALRAEHAVQKRAAPLTRQKVKRREISSRLSLPCSPVLPVRSTFAGRFKHVNGLVCGEHEELFAVGAKAQTRPFT